MMIEGIRAALDFPHDPKRLRVVSFMTDGFIGNEMQIFTEVRKRLGSARIFSFGVGNSVNRYLLEGLARLGKGAVAFVGLDEAAGTKVDRFYERVRRPAFTHLEVDWRGLGITDVYPRRLPDLFVGRPVLITGRFADDIAPDRIRITGQAGGETRVISVTPSLDGAADAHPAIPLVWARAKIAELSDFATSDPEAVYAGQAKQTALTFGLVSAYTSFLAVDASRRTEGGHGTTVAVPVPVPDGVRYETTVTER
jgi:Ca-activated chloride channel family protein